ncbi:MAG: hypothetical protein KIT54_00695 [Phycisphaeraceae bacterium]|nr:hypothetical protein [Phycisphaeraceae bacterium]
MAQPAIGGVLEARAVDGTFSDLVEAGQPSRVRRAWSIPWTAAGSRGRRVAMYLIAICFLSLADLAMTLDHMKGPGMYESNPLARLIMHWGSPASLAMFKCMTLLLGCWLLWRTRHSRAAEIGAIICLVALTWLMLRWNHYSAQMAELTPHLAEVRAYHSDTWVAVTGDR